MDVVGRHENVNLAGVHLDCESLAPVRKRRSAGLHGLGWKVLLRIPRVTPLQIESHEFGEGNIPFVGDKVHRSSQEKDLRVFDIFVKVPPLEHVLQYFSYSTITEGFHTSSKTVDLIARSVSREGYTARRLN